MSSRSRFVANSSLVLLSLSYLYPYNISILFMIIYIIELYLDINKNQINEPFYFLLLLLKY